ncbi:MAG: SCO family protein [Gallionellaceae bacterium]|nr:SCO family protein [Gallionellaceae bacterium]
MNSLRLLQRSALIVAVALSLGLAVISEAALGGEHDHHHHAQGMDVMSDSYTRSLASYNIPDLKLVDMNGSAVSLREGLGGNDPVMLNFIFTTCTAVCPVMSATFHLVQTQLGAESSKLRMISISIDPENDTPAKLREYAARYQAGPQWTMLTGSAESSIAVQRAFGTFRGDKMNHAPATFIRAGGAGKPWLRLDGFASAPDIINEYHRLASR